jgi:hypothetical protein
VFDVVVVDVVVVVTCTYQEVVVHIQDIVAVDDAVALVVVEEMASYQDKEPYQDDYNVVVVAVHDVAVHTCKDVVVVVHMDSYSFLHRETMVLILVEVVVVVN